MIAPVRRGRAPPGLMQIGRRTMAGSVRALVLGVVLLAATAAQAEDRKCIRKFLKYYYF